VSFLQSQDLTDGMALNVRVRNVGMGIGTDVWGVLIPYADPKPYVPPQFSFHDHLPLGTGETREMAFHVGGTIFTAGDRVGRNQIGVPVELAPEVGYRNTNDRRSRVVARLTLTCRDLVRLRHAFVYDFDQVDHWVSVDTGNVVRKDLRDLDEEKGTRPAPR
jgi:hypothetical protein